jgi:hypothetical protein
VHIGTLLNLNEAAAFAPNALNCKSKPDTQYIVQQRPDTDSTMSGDVYVIVTATVTYAIAR